jgi:hypothetical protein
MVEKSTWWEMRGTPKEDTTQSSIHGAQQTEINSGTDHDQSKKIGRIEYHVEQVYRTLT